MADSNITKKALAAALKELMESRPFAKISVRDICEACDMNRKSFYYHFRDKQDLVNWIFYTEAILPLQDGSGSRIRDILSDICRHLYENRCFYRKAFQIAGQNSFSDYFRETMEPLLVRVSEKLLADEADQAFYLHFFAGTYMSAIERWIREPDCIPAEDFVRKSRECLIRIAAKMLEYDA